MKGKNQMSKILIVFGGLPGTGKSTISKRLIEKVPACYLRIDVIEQALKSDSRIENDVGINGYIVAYELARANLKLGQSVISDSVNPLFITRNAWRNIAIETNSPLLEIEVICTNNEEHRKRIETREADILGLKLPTWEQVLNREYEPWDIERLIVDTAKENIESILQKIQLAIDKIKIKPK
jgi:predicted kinase